MACGGPNPRVSPIEDQWWRQSAHSRRTTPSLYRVSNNETSRGSELRHTSAPRPWLAARTSLGLTGRPGPPHVNLAPVRRRIPGHRRPLPSDLIARGIPIAVTKAKRANRSTIAVV